MNIIVGNCFQFYNINKDQFHDQFNIKYVLFKELLLHTGSEWLFYVVIQAMSKF